jgi:sugar phosphate isomerase/epimerase
MAKSLIACRISSYGPYVALAYEHLAGLGIRFVEIPLPAPGELDAVRAALQQHGLSASSIHGECDLARADVAEQVAAQMPTFAALGTRTMFVSVKAGDTPLATAFGRLHEAGEVAGRHGVTIVLETHPDLLTRADVALETMRAVDHPYVRINYDTANIYFYNRDVDGVEELRRVVPYVGAVHLKDTDGGYQHWHFPALGRGIVRFSEVFRILDQAGFSGPCTIEIEGVEGETRTERLVCDRIAASVGYLRGLGRL